MELILIFITGFIASYIGSLPPGLINLNAARIAILKSKNDAEKYNIGASFASFIYAIIAVYTFNNINIDESIFEMLYIGGAVILFVIAIFFLVKYYKLKKQVETKAINYRSSIKYGFNLSLLNIVQLPYYLTICIIYLNNKAEHNTINYIFVLAIALGMWSILSTYKYIFLKYSGKKIIEKYFFKYAYLILSILCTLLSIITIAKI